MENNNLPEEFYKSTNFYTLAGTAGAVWLLCIVIGSLDINNEISPFFYRIIAITVSMVISIIMTFRKEIIKAEYWLFAFFNGLLIFVNASGLNAITSNHKFGYSIETKNNKNQVKLINDSKLNTASFFNLKFKNVSWWEDNSLFVENRKLKNEKSDLLFEIKRVTKKNEVITKLNDSITKQIKNKTFINIQTEAATTKYDKGRNENELTAINKKSQLEINKLNVMISKLKQEISEKDSAIEKLKLSQKGSKGNIDCTAEIRKLQLEIIKLKDKYIECMDNYNR